MNKEDVKTFIKDYVPEYYTKYDTYGTWKVTSTNPEGTTDYGVWAGCIDEIALTIGETYGSLEFCPCTINSPKDMAEISDDVNAKILLPFKGHYQIYMDDKEQIYKEIFKNRPVVIEHDGWMYIRKRRSKSDEEEIKRQKALEKLTDEEKELLGLD